MENNSPLRKALMDVEPRPSLSSFLTPLKTPSIPEKFQQAFKPFQQTPPPVQEPQRREPEKVENKNPKHRINGKKFCNLIDEFDVQKVNIELLTTKSMSLENQIRSLQEENKRMKQSFQEKEKTPSLFKKIDWRSFALGILTLALGAVFVIWKL